MYQSVSGSVKAMLLMTSENSVSASPMRTM